MMSCVAIAGYRSLRDIRLPLGRLTIVTGSNGSGKSSLYRALRLLADVAQGRAIGSLAAEGGLKSTLWAGPERIAASVKRGTHPVEGTVRTAPVSLKLGFSGEDFGYAIDLGLPVQSASQFNLDPAIKVEALWLGEKLGRHNVLAMRTGPLVRVRGESGAWRQASTTLASVDSMMTQCADAHDGAELLALRERMRAWRFYDHLRTDRDAPARRPHIGTHTPILDSDGNDLAAALQTIREIGDAGSLDAVIADAFPGSSFAITNTDGLFDVSMRQHGLLRSLRASELSDGTLRYLLLSAALLSPRPPALMVLNEPETSLHPDLLGPLARLIAQATERSQIVVVTHAEALLRPLQATGSARHIRLDKQFGETSAPDVDAPSWAWPTR